MHIHPTAFVTGQQMAAYAIRLWNMNTDRVGNNGVGYAIHSYISYNFVEPAEQTR